MQPAVKRREFLQLTVVGTMLGLAVPGRIGWGAEPKGPKLISPGCRKSKVKVARLFMANPGGQWPKPGLDLEAEVRSYKEAFAAMKDELADIDFVADTLVTSPDQVKAIQETLKGVDGILVVHLNIGISSILQEILKAERPTVVFAIPYSGHEWAGFGALMKQPAGAKLDCMLTTDRKQLAVAIRPFRALHHLREAKILDVTTRLPAQYADDVKAKFGTQIQQVSLERVEKAYQAVGDADARAETERWIKQATAVVEPSPEEVFKSCRLALAFERLLDEDEATVMTVDCYGTMWDKTIKLPAYPCLGFSRLNSMGLGGICESDLRSAMTHILFQGLAGKPGFISDPTVDESDGTIILAHCMGTRNMEGPGKPAAPYKLRTVMERQEGVVPQVKLPIGEKATQALLVGTASILYFTGLVVDSPDVDRGCRTKITVKVDGDVEKLWKQWSNGLHRVTCYGDLAEDLQRFCRFADIKLIDEAA
jgi:L-arabinose isomerase